MASMNDQPRSKWASLLSGVPRSVPPPPSAPGNVVHLPRPSLDARAERIRSLDNQLMDIAIDIDRLGLRFNTIRDELMRERESILTDLKETGIKGEFVHIPPEAERLKPGP